MSIEAVSHREVSTRGGFLTLEITLGPHRKKRAETDKYWPDQAFPK